MMIGPHGAGNASIGALAKIWTDASVDNHSKYLIFLAIPINLLLWGCESWALRTSLLKKLEVFLHRSIRRIPGISMTEVKDQRITNETVRRIFFGILNIEEQIAKRQLPFIGKVTNNSDEHLFTKLLTAWCNHKRRRGGVLHTNKNPLSTTFVSSYQEWTKPEHSKHGCTFPLMRDTGNT